MDQEQRSEMFKNRVAELDKLHPGYLESFEEMREYLLSKGGWDVVPGFEPDPLVFLMKDYGSEMAGEIELNEMEVSKCHDNTMNWYESLGDKNSAYVCTGYCLSDDGLWRGHSWGLANGKIVETTVARKIYFGLMYKPDEASAKKQ